MNSPLLIDRVVYQFLLGVLFLCPSLILAGTEQYETSSKETPLVEKTWCETPKPLEIRIGLPAWLAGVSGESGVKGVVDSVDVRFDQVLKHLTHFPIALAADVRYQRWEFFMDGQYIELGTSATLPGLLFTDANVHIKNALAEGFVGYRLVNCDKASLSIFAGARYTYLQGDLSIFDNGDARLVRLRELLGIQKRLDFSDSIDWVDPVIGVRGKVKIWKATSVDLTSTLTLRLNCAARGGLSCGNRWIVPTGVTRCRAGSNFNSHVRFGRRSDGAT